MSSSPLEGMAEEIINALTGGIGSWIEVATKKSGVRTNMSTISLLIRAAKIEIPAKGELNW